MFGQNYFRACKAQGPLGVVVTQYSPSATPGSDAKSRLSAVFPLLRLSSVTSELSWCVICEPRALEKGSRVSVCVGTVRVGVGLEMAASSPSGSP